MLKRALILCLLVGLTTGGAGARGESMTFIRDAEIESYLRDLGYPIFRAAGLESNAISLLIIQDSAINAFVAGGMNIFFFTGLIEKTETPEELQAVLAHEVGHIAGGHLIQGKAAMRDASAQAILGTIAGLVAGLAAGDARVAIGAVGGAQSMAERGLFKFSRAQESAADAAALRFLDHTGQSADGMLGFMKKLAGQDLLPLERQSEYVRTHPLSSDRVAAIEHHLNNQGSGTKKLPKTLQDAHERVKAKLLGYLRPQTALLRYTDKDTRESARYARAIALYRTNQPAKALALLDGLLRVKPNDPFYLEQKAQILFEKANVAEAAALYKRAVELRPDSALLRLAYGHALLELGNDRVTLAEAIEQLMQARRLEERNPQAWRFLATAWGKMGKLDSINKYQGLTLYALAEEAVAMGKDKDAQRYAERAIQALEKGSPYWIRAQDIRSSTKDIKD